MKTIAIIPARLNSTRLPRKLLQDLNGKPVIIRVMESAKKLNLFSDVIVATDSKEIYNSVLKNGGKAFLNKKQHNSGTDRIEEASHFFDADIIVNIQGDEPFLDKKTLQNLILSFEDENVKVASLMHKMNNWDEISNPNNVKVITDKNNDAIYFSRSIIPFNRDNLNSVNYFKHIGIYAFRKEYLTKFVSWESSQYEKIEKLEQLRFLENGIKIRMIETDFVSIGIDTLQDLEKARTYFKN